MNDSTNIELPRRLVSSDIAADEYWADAYAKAILRVYPDREKYTVAAGISPSGIVHFGNFRDVATSFAVMKALEKHGKKVRFIFSWDNYDRLRKVPQGIPESFVEHIGRPLTGVPDPLGEFSSYAERFQTAFVESIVEIGIPLEYRNQTQEYTSGTYAEEVILAMQKREEIADVLLSFMSNKGKEAKGVDPVEYRAKFYPITIYSRFSGKDTTKILSYNGDAEVTYKCIETGQEDTVDLRHDFCVKLNWKVDWAMRWYKEQVVFEPGGKDHASPNGSYDVSSALIREIYGSEPPFFAGYEFVGIQGVDGKMSGSKGGAVSPGQLLEIYEPALVKWLYLRKTPQQVFNLAFDSEVIRQYDEFDREVKAMQEGTLPVARYEALDFAGGSEYKGEIVSFRQAASLGQILQWDLEKIKALAVDLGTPYNEEILKSRVAKAKAWLETYNPSELIVVFDVINETYAKELSEEDKKQVRDFREALAGGELIDIKTLETVMYDIPKDPNLSQKENSPRQRAFFKNLYQLLIGRDTGPRLSTFLWALDRKKVLDLLDV